MTLSAACRVYIAFSDGPLVESPTWTNVTAYVREVRISRGRQNELDDFQAGTATIVLDNRTRRFDPDYTSGAYYPNVKVRRQIKVESVYSGFEPIFRGLIQSWQQQWPGKGKDATTTVQCADLFSLLATWELPDTAHELVARTLSPSSFWGLEESTSTAVDRMGVSNGTYTAARQTVDALEANGAGASKSFHADNAGSSHIAQFGFGPAATASTSTSLAAIVNARRLVESYNGVVAVDVSAEFLSLYDTASGSTRDLRLGLTAAGEPTGSLGTTQAYPSTLLVDGSTHHVALVRSGVNLTVYVDGVSVATSGSASSASVQYSYGYIGKGPTGTSISSVARAHDITVDEAAVWHGTALTGTQVALLYEAVDGWANDTADSRIQRILDLLGVPSGLYSLGAASSSVGVFEGGTDAVSYLQSVARSDRGRLFVNRSGVITFQPKTTDMGGSSAVTFADDSTANAIRYSGFELELDDRLIYNDITVTGVEGSSHSAQDSTSIATYSRRSRTFDTELPPSACRDSVAYYLDRYAEPQVRGRSWTVHPERTLIGSSTRGWDSVVVRELGDIVTIKRTPAVGSPISKTVQITSIEHNIDLPEGKWDVTFTGAPVDTATAFRWGTSTWGGSDGWS